MNKIMRIGTIPQGGRRASVFVRVKMDGGRISFTGVIGPLSSGNAMGGCGQIDMGFARRNKADNDPRYGELIQPHEFNFAPGWTAHKWLDLLDLWRRWHLNDMKAGSAVQEAYLRERPIYAIYPEIPYEKASKILADAGLNPDADGYKYGHPWKSEAIPPEVLEQIAAFPDADKQPAWC